MLITVDLSDDDIMELKQMYKHAETACVRTKNAEVKVKYKKTESVLEKIVQACSQ